MSALRSGPALALTLALLGLEGGCANDFDVFTPVVDGGGSVGDSGGGADGSSGGTGNDGGRDAQGSDGAACTPSPSCLATARSCARDCGRGEPQCVQRCQQTCVTCTQAAACPAASDCANAVR